MREKEVINKESLLGCWLLQLDRWVRGTMGAFFSEPALFFVQNIRILVVGLSRKERWLMLQNSLVKQTDVVIL